MPVSDPDVSRTRLIRDARFLEADRRETALRRGRDNRLGFAYLVAFVRVLGRWKNVPGPELLLESLPVRRQTDSAQRLVDRLFRRAARSEIHGCLAEDVRGNW